MYSKCNYYDTASYTIDIEQNGVILTTYLLCPLVMLLGRVDINVLVSKINKTVTYIYPRLISKTQGLTRQAAFC